jgi:hypothetical protein
MTWLFIALALVAIAMTVWLKRMGARYDRAFTEQEERLKAPGADRGLRVGRRVLST